MFKLLAVLLAFPLLGASEVYAQQTDTVETELDRSADNLNIVPAEVRIDLRRKVRKDIDLNLKNSTKGQVSDIIKTTNSFEQRSAKNEGRVPERAIHIDPNNKPAVRNMLQKNLNIDPYPKLYE